MEMIPENEFTQRNRFTDQEMTYIKALVSTMGSQNIPDSRYSLSGYGEACICLRRVGENWEVYEGEREIKYNPVVVASLKDACIEIITRTVEKERQGEALYDLGRFVTKLRVQGKRLSPATGKIGTTSDFVIRDHDGTLLVEEGVLGQWKKPKRKGKAARLAAYVPQVDVRRTKTVAARKRKIPHSFDS